MSEGTDVLYEKLPGILQKGIETIIPTRWHIDLADLLPNGESPRGVRRVSTPFIFTQKRR